MTGIQGLQENFLNQARSGKLMLTVFLVNGFQLRGTVTGFDTFTVVLDSEGKQQLIYKHAISTIIPIRPIALEPEQETEQETEQAEYAEQ
jgi:host factor-I protein